MIDYGLTRSGRLRICRLYAGFSLELWRVVFGSLACAWHVHNLIIIRVCLLTNHGKKMLLQEGQKRPKQGDIISSPKGLITRIPDTNHPFEITYLTLLLRATTQHTRTRYRVLRRAFPSTTSRSGPVST